MIPNEGPTAETAEDVEVKESDDTEAVEEEEDEPEKTWEFKNEQILAKKYRVSLDGCVYRGEGNANVVLALPSYHRVLRFRKSSPTSQASADGGRARTTREIEFLKYVISGFLGDYVEPPKPLQVTREDLVKVAEAIRPLRPENRRRKEIVEDYATMFADYAFLPKKITTSLQNDSLEGRATFCVEIKPKQGFRHEFDEQFKKCTYCLTQYYKLKTGSIHSLSSYCPYDLFSGDIERMKKSILGLVQSPQNNLKIFKDGVVVYDFSSEPNNIQTIFDEWFSTAGPQTGEQNFENFYKLVSTALLKEFSSKTERNQRTNNKLGSFSSSLDFEPRIDPDIVSRAKKILSFSGDECNFSGNELPAGSVLGKIFHMQQLPYHSAELVYRVYSKHFASLNDETVYSQMIRIYRGENKVSVSDGEKMDNDEDLGCSKAANSSVKLSKSRTRVGDSNGNERKSVFYPAASVSSSDLENNNNFRRMGSEKGSITIEELEALQNYLLVTTAKDCSILMAFREIDSKNVKDIPAEYIVQTTDEVNFVVNIGVLDLDPKSIHCVEKHRLRDTNVLVSLTNMLEEQLDFRNELPDA